MYRDEGYVTAVAASGRKLVINKHLAQIHEKTQVAFAHTERPRVNVSLLHRCTALHDML
jgi:hypothetical protein